MSEKKVTAATEVETLETQHRATNFWDTYSKPIIYAGAAIILLIAGWYGYKNFIAEPKEKDPIEHVLKVLKEQYKVPDSDIETIVERVKSEVEESVKFAEESPWPSDDELLKDVYVQQDYPFIMD